VAKTNSPESLSSATATELPSTIGGSFVIVVKNIQTAWEKDDFPHIDSWVTSDKIGSKYDNDIFESLSLKHCQGIWTDRVSVETPLPPGLERRCVKLIDDPEHRCPIFSSFPQEGAFSLTTGTESKSPLYFSTRDLLIIAVLAALGGVASTYINTLGDAVHAALGMPGATQWAAGLHVIWIVLSVGILRKPGTGTVAGIFKGAVELMSGNSHGVIILLVNLVAGLVVDFGFLLFQKKQSLWPYLVAGGLATGSNVLVFQVFATIPLNILGLSAIFILFFVAFASGLLFAGFLPFLLVNTLTKAGVVRFPKISSQPRKIGWWILLGVSILAVLLAVFLKSNLRGPQAIRINGAVEEPITFPSSGLSIENVTRQMEYRGVMTEYTGFPLEEIIKQANPSPDADTVLIEASDGYAFLISFEELTSNENILLVQGGQGKNAAHEVVGPESSKAWVRNVTQITVIAADGLEIVDLESETHTFNPDEWVSEMDSAQVNLPEGSQKLQGVPVWKVLSKHSSGQEPSKVNFASDSQSLTLTWLEIKDNDDLRIFTVIKEDNISFALANMSGEVQSFPLKRIEAQ
jgi:ABC-type thiamin/hydroxymethylpyrimidine transport system permease subunit